MAKFNAARTYLIEYEVCSRNAENLTVFHLRCYDTMMIFMFQDFVTGLSILSRGSIDEKLRWTFSLYDINGDGCITREEMTDIVTAVYELMGKFSDPNLDPEGVREKVDRMFQVRKRNQIFESRSRMKKNFKHFLFNKMYIMNIYN